MSDIVGATSTPVINRIGLDAPWLWLAAGWRDLWAYPSVALGYGGLVVVISWIVTAALIYADAWFLVLPLAAGFVQLGPVLAVALYEAARRVESGERIDSLATFVVRIRSPLQLAVLGFFLVFLTMAWVYAAIFLFALFFGLQFPPLADLVPTLLLTYRGVAFLVIGTAVGAGFAFAAFAISAVSIPRLLEKDEEAITAMLLSVRAVRENFWPMMLWAWLIAVLTAIGIALFYVGLLITYPLVGFATWHAYRALVGDSGRV